jgi:hypothetical protein
MLSCPPHYGTSFSLAGKNGISDPLICINFESDVFAVVSRRKNAIYLFVELLPSPLGYEHLQASGVEYQRINPFTSLCTEYE